MLLLADDPLLVDRFPPTDLHNVSSNIIRLGLSVNAFASLEKYIENCFEFTFAALAASPFQYVTLPDDMREFLTVKAIEGLSTRGGFIQEADRLSYFETNIPTLAKFGASPPTFTAFGFSPRGSNVSAGDISGALKVLKVKKPWDALSSIAAAIGYSSVDMQSDYVALAKSRHRAAHNPQASLPSANLKQNLRSAILIGIAVDILTKQVATMWAGSSSIATIATQLAATTPPLRFLDDDGAGSIVERATSAGRSIKRYADESSAESGAAGRASRSFVIRRDASRRPIGLVSSSAGPSAL